LPQIRLLGERRMPNQVDIGWPNGLIVVGLGSGPR
jgi:hypothetical protein